MGAGFDSKHSYTLPLGAFFFAMLIAAGLMSRLGPERYAPRRAEPALGVANAGAPIQAEGGIFAEVNHLIVPRQTAEGNYDGATCFEHHVSTAFAGTQPFDPSSSAVRCSQIGSRR